MERIVLGVSGHRPPRLGLDYSKKSQNLLYKFAASQLERFEKQFGFLPPDEIISGMANGWDWACAQLADNWGIPLHAAIPFSTQHSKWPPDAQKDYLLLLSKAHKIEIVCEGGYAPWKFIWRDHYVVENSSHMLFLFDGTNKGGTAETFEYAKSKRKIIINCWDQWIKFKRDNSVV